MVRCLLVANASPVTDQVKSSLAGLGIDVRQAESAHDLLTSVRGQRCDFLLMEDSADTVVYLSRMRMARSGRDPVVVVYSDCVKVSDINSAIAEGASEYVVTPITPDLLEFKLRQAGVPL